MILFPTNKNLRGKNNMILLKAWYFKYLFYIAKVKQIGFLMLSINR